MPPAKDHSRLQAYLRSIKQCTEATKANVALAQTQLLGTLRTSDKNTKDQKLLGPKGFKWVTAEGVG